MKGGVTKTITAAKSRQAILTLCRVLKRNGIDYSLSAGNCVRCSINVHESEISFIFSVDPSKMLVTLYSRMFSSVPRERSTDAALAICMINHSLPDGTICFDVRDGMIYYKMTSSFYDSGLSDSIIEYMLSAAADTVESYRPSLTRLLTLKSNFAS